MMGQKWKYSEILPPLIAFHLIIAATSWLSTGFSFRISWTLLVSIEFTTVSTFLTSFSAFSWFFWISCFFRLTKVSRKLMHANSTKAVNTKVSHTNKSIISLTSSNNQFSKFRIFFFVYFFIEIIDFFVKHIFFEARLERVTDGTADCWSYFWSSKK